MLKLRLLTTAGLVLILIGVVLISHSAPVLFFLAGNLFVLLGMREFVRMTGGIRGVGMWGAFLVFSLVFFRAISADPAAFAPFLSRTINPAWEEALILLIVAGLFLFEATRSSGKDITVRISVTLAGIIYVAWLFSFLVKINYYKFGTPGYDGRWYLFFLFLVVKVNDSAAYLIGSQWGRNKLIARISPSKTVEGTVGGVLGGGLAGVAGKYLFSLERINWPAALTLGLVLGAVAVVADLAESMLKRDRGVKDSGSLLPGLGGVLDLFDSIYFTAPVLYLYMVLVLKL